MDCGGAQERWKLRQGKQDLIVHSLGRSPPDILARAHSFGRRIFIKIKYPNLGLLMARSIEDTVLKGDKFMRFSNTERMTAHLEMRFICAKSGITHQVCDIVLLGLAWIEYAAGFIRSDDRTTTQTFGRVVNLEYKATSLVKSSQELAANVKGACSYQRRRNRISRHSGFDGRSGNAHEPTAIGPLKGKLNERLRFMQPFSLTCRTVGGLGLAVHRSSSFNSK